MEDKAAPASRESSGKGGESRRMGRGLFSSAAGILLGRVTGLLRDMCGAAFWGATGVAQAAYTTAFSVPNSFRMLLGEGAFTSAFVPMVSAHLAQDRQERAWRLACRTISLQTAILLAFSLFLGILGGLLGVSHFFQGETVRTTFQLLPVLMPFSILICAAGAFASILNCLNSFFAATLAQGVFNLVQVASLILLGWGWTNQDEAALWLYCGSTLLAGFLQLLFLVLACRRRGFVFHWDFSWRDQEVILLCRRILPGLVGAGLMQLNSLVDKGFGLILGAAAVGALNYSQRLVYLPVGLFGVAMGMVALPALSRAQARGDDAEVGEGLDYALGMVLFLALPCTAFLLTAGYDVVELLFARGAFQQKAIDETTYTLLFYLAGIPAFCCAKIATHPFYARKDTLTPMKISASFLGVNLLLNLLLMRFYRQGGLALSTSICSWGQVLVLLALNRRLLPRWSFLPFLKSLLLLAPAAYLAARLARWLIHALPPCLDGLVPLPRLLLLLVEMGLFAVLYLLFCLLLRRREPRELLQSLRRR
ncbi:MAG: murein biosynthesis integral membrane protein MurJ [Oligosphaeraceae bacterium]